MTGVLARPHLLLRRRIGENDMGVDPRSRYVDHFWIPTIGPTATCLARVLMRMVARRGETVEVQTSHLIAVLGLDRHWDLDGELGRAFDTLVSTGILAKSPEGDLLIGTQFPVLTAEQVDRLPRSLAEAHGALGSVHAAAHLDAPTSRAQSIGPHARILSLAATVDEIVVNPSLDPGQLAFRWEHVVRLAEEARDDAVLDWAPSDLEATIAEGHLAIQALGEAFWDAQRSIANRRSIAPEIRRELREAAAGVIDWLVSEFPSEDHGALDDL